MGAGTENQKEVSEKYRTNWDQIFKAAKEQQEESKQPKELPEDKE